MLRRVMKYIRDKELLKQGDKVLVCVSGGADSIALLDVLHRGGFDCIIAHCNFHLRGKESDRDEAFVRNIVGEWQATFSAHTRREAVDCSLPQQRLWVKHFDTTAYAKLHGLSIEMAARELRYQWFAELATQHSCQAIAVAHHQHDQAETILLNLKRGTGIRGLCGMRPKAHNPYKAIGSDIPIIRPLLCTTRDYIEHYLRDIRHLHWVNDSTNTDTTIKRNAVREQLKHYSKAEIEHIAATAEHMQGYVDWLEGKETREAGLAKLFEQLKDYGFAEIDKIYDAHQRGVGGKEFRSATHKAVIHKGEIIVERIQTKD